MTFREAGAGLAWGSKRGLENERDFPVPRRGGSRESAPICQDEVANFHRHQREGKSMPIVTIGIDLAKNVEPPRESWKLVGLS